MIFTILNPACAYSALRLELTENDKAYLARYIHEIEKRYLLHGLLSDQKSVSFGEYRHFAVFSCGAQHWTKAIDDIIFELYHYSYSLIPCLIVSWETFLEYIYGDDYND